MYVGDFENSELLVAGGTLSQEDIVERTQGLISPEGAWTRLEKAGKEIAKQITPFLYPREYDAKIPPDEAHPAERDAGLVCETRPWRDGMESREMQDRLAGDYGLLEELSNGPGFYIQYGLRQKLVGRKHPLEIPYLFVHNFDQPSKRSQMTGTPKNPCAETFGEAYPRLANDVEQWLGANSDVVDADKQAIIRTQLGEYRLALADVFAYAATTKESLAHIGYQSSHFHGIGR
ncbi:MAG: hypothetical protein V4735_07820 [Pseudomonadota bacterium]